MSGKKILSIWLHRLFARHDRRVDCCCSSRKKRRLCKTAKTDARQESSSPLWHLNQRGLHTIKQTGKAKAYNTCIAPEAACRNCSGAGHVTDWAGVGPIGRRLSLRPQADLWPTSHTQPVCRLNGLHHHNPCTCNCMDYYSFTDPGGMEGWVSLVGWHIADTLTTKWSHVNHRSGIDQGKSASQRPRS